MIRFNIKLSNFFLCEYSGIFACLHTHWEYDSVFFLDSIPFINENINWSACWVHIEPTRIWNEAATGWIFWGLDGCLDPLLGGIRLSKYSQARLITLNGWFVTRRELVNVNVNGLGVSRRDQHFRREIFRRRKASKWNSLTTVTLCELALLEGYSDS